MNNIETALIAIASLLVFAGFVSWFRYLFRKEKKRVAFFIRKTK
jgi:hypothetical protein